MKKYLLEESLKENDTYKYKGQNDDLSWETTPDQEMIHFKKGDEIKIIKFGKSDKLAKKYNNAYGKNFVRVELISSDFEEYLILPSQFISEYFKKS